MVVIVVALEDCTISVTTAPQKAPDSGVAAALPSTVLSLDPASPLRPAVMTLMPSRNRPTPPRTEIVVDIRAPSRAPAAPGDPSPKPPPARKFPRLKKAIGQRRRLLIKAASALSCSLHDERIASARPVVDPYALGLEVSLDRLHAIFPPEA